MHSSESQITFCDGSDDSTDLGMLMKSPPPLMPSGSLQSVERLLHPLWHFGATHGLWWISDPLVGHTE